MSSANMAQQYKNLQTRTIDINKKYVLVVEDNCMISLILDQTLQSMGYHAIVAENGRIAVDKFTNFLKQG